MNEFLIVVDVQNDFINGSLGNKEAEAAVPRIKEKVNEYIKKGKTILFTRDTHDDNYLFSAEGEKLPINHCIKETYGWQIGLEVIPGRYMIIDKTTFGYKDWKLIFERFGMKEREPNKIEICGLDTDICVITNALIIKTLYPEAMITVDASCCAGSTPEKHKAALEVMKSCQIDVIGE